MNKKEADLLLCIFLLGFAVVGGYWFQDAFPKATPLSNTQKWLIERQIPFEVVTCLNDELSEKLKMRMENTVYEIGTLNNYSTSGQIELMFTMHYIEGDEAFIESYYIQKSKRSPVVQKNASVKCLWNKDEVALESFECNCCIENYEACYEIFNSSRPAHAGLGYYEVQFPLSANEVTGVPCIVVVSNFVPARQFVEEYDSIQYICERTLFGR